MIINFDPFFVNSSSEEAICLFCIKKYTFEQFSLACWSRACKNQIKKLKRLGYKKSIMLAKKALKQKGFDLQDYNDF